jgi:hypothetical protein
MLKLPVETLRHISNHLDRSSLLDFSTTNRQCRLASSPLIFQDVCVRFSSPESLYHSVERCQKVLVSSNSFKYVHHLRVVAAELYPLCELIDDGGDGSLHNFTYCGISGFKTTLVTSEEEWQPLTRLVKTLFVLRSFTWGCLEQVPCYILDIVDDKVPRCWLHIDNFFLRSLVQPSSASVTIDSGDLKVATAQCLRSLVIQCDYVDSYGYDNYNPQAVMEMVSGAAPNLQTVRLIWHRGASRLASNRPVILLAKEPQSNLLPCEQQRLGHLDHLEIVEGDSGHVLKLWNLRTNFGLLQSLEVHYPLATSDFVWLKDNCHFESLHTLAVNLCTSVGENDLQGDLTDAVEALLLSIPPLRSVKLTGDYSQRIVESVLDRCKLSLRTLLLGPLRERGTGVIANIPFIHTIKLHCPNLEELAVPFMRCQGDASEVAVYRSLAQLPAIRRLHLAMYSREAFLWDQDSPLDLDSQIYDRKPGLRDQFCRAAVDLAIDQALAANIFRIITISKSRSSPVLESLEIHVEALRILGGFNSVPKMIHWLQYIGRSWTCTPKVRDDMRGQCRIVEYDDEHKLDRQDVDELGAVDQEIRTRFGSLLSHVWPGIDSGNWRAKWHSFPLSA